MTNNNLNDMWVPNYQAYILRFVYFMSGIVIALGFASASWLMVVLGVAALIYAIISDNDLDGGNG